MLLQQKLFAFLCIPVRMLFVAISKFISPDYLPYLGYAALIPASGFAYIYLTNSRQTGQGVFGGKIWWNNLRPVHSLLYFAFAYNAITGNSGSAWLYLLADVIVGITASLTHYYT